MDKFFVWKDEYSLGIKEIDEQHKYFVNLLDNIYQTVLTNEDRKLIGDKLNELKDYTIKHFATEEKYFDEFAYPEAEEHKLAHRDLEKNVLDFQEKFKNNKIEVSFDLIDFLEDWLIEHLAHMDMKYVKCFHDHGLR